MKKLFFNKRATAIMEYAMLAIILLAAFLVTQKYIVRGFAGRWKQVGDSFGYGRQYDPKKTVECSWHDDPSHVNGGVWYNTRCFESNYDNNYNVNFSNCLSTCRNTSGCSNFGNCDPSAGSASCCVTWTVGGFSFTFSDLPCCFRECKKACGDWTRQWTAENQCPNVTIEGLTQPCTNF